MKLILLFLFSFFVQNNYSNAYSVPKILPKSRACKPIYTPEFDAKNKFVINAPIGWGYRTFNSDNGLIGVLWPRGTSFSSTETAVFVFLQDTNIELFKKKPKYSNIFTEKCPKAAFRFAKNEDMNDKTKSIEEKYFSGRCGRTRILFEEKVKNYRLIILLVSGHDIPAKLFNDVRYTVSAYRKEIEKSFGLDEDEKENTEQQKD